MTPAIAVLVTWGSLLTIANAAWELSRKIKKKEAKWELEREARIALANLHEAYNHGLVSAEEYDRWLTTVDAETDRKYATHIFRDLNSNGSKLWL